MTREEAIKILKSKMDGSVDTSYEWAETVRMAINALEQTDTTGDTISRQAAIDAVKEAVISAEWEYAEEALERLPSAQPERTWHSCGEPPKHHKNVLVRGIEAIGNVTVHKVMQWDVDRWRPTDYAPSIVWKEWSEI